MHGSSSAGAEGRRIWATPTGIADSLSTGIVHATNMLRIRLQHEGFPSRDPKRFGSDACIVECVVFEWFLRDLVISAEFGRHRGAIRRALAARLHADLERSGLPPTALMHFEEIHRPRFAEYARALEATSSLQALGEAVWFRMVGGPEPSDSMTMFLALRATASLRALQGLAKRYTVIGPLRARLRPPREDGPDPAGGP